MQVSVEATSGLERKITVEVPASQIDQEVDKRLQQLARTQRIAGFRPGKVPLSVIKKRFAVPVRQEVAGDVIQRSFFEAVSKENLKPAGMPSINPLTNEYGKDLSFEATFEVFPEVNVTGIDNIEIEKFDVQITDSDLETMLETLRKQRQTWQAVERESQEGDKLMVDFEGKIDGETFEGGTANDFSVVLGSKSMIPGFEAGLEGLKADASKTLDLSFPDDYHSDDLKGKAVQFDVTVKQVEAPVLPDLDEDFVKTFGIDDGSFEKLQEEVRKNMQRELDQTIKNKIKESVIQQLLDANEVEIPRALVDQEINVLRNQALQQFGQAQPGASLPEIPGSLFEEQAIKRVKSGLLVSEVVKSNTIKVDQDKIKSTVENLASAYENPEEVVNWYYSNKQQMEQIEAIVLEDQVIELICEKGKVVEKTVSFDEVMNAKGSQG